MPDDRLDKRREIAAERLTMAQQISDLDLRASFVAMAQKWLDRAHDEPGSDLPDARNSAFSHYVIQTNIGRELRGQFELSQEMPHRILALLMQINNRPDK